ncbi:Aste57867_11284 [Aphanomyces stellatus]|nr:hypothetical protein As57867_011242 [Aphanomyces stellatus]VFT88146.1 Aste57867_11284 [Aphanomyces stellatus]
MALERCDKNWQTFHDMVPATLDIEDPTNEAARPQELQTLECLNTRAQLVREQQHLATRVKDVGTKMHFLESSLNEVERMMDVSQAIRSSLFDSFHASEFKGYSHVQSPKEAIKALMALFS